MRDRRCREAPTKTPLRRAWDIAWASPGLRVGIGTHTLAIEVDISADQYVGRAIETNGSCGETQTCADFATNE
jgi:hypothetical protein